VNKYHLSYYTALQTILDLSGLTIDDFADKANISPSVIRHADEDWNPKFDTVERICSVINISISSFFLIAEHQLSIKNSITLKYVMKNNYISVKFLNEKLQELRLNSNMSRSQLSKKTGICKANICNREHSKITNKMLCSTLEKYALSFGLTMSELCEILEKEI